MREPIEPSAEPVISLAGVELQRDAAFTLSFEVPAGSTLFVVGPEGCGKTTLMEMMSLRRRPVRGRLRILGVDAEKLPNREIPAARRRLGLMFQEDRLLNDLSAAGNVALPAWAAGRPASDFSVDVTELLAWVGLGGRGAEPVGRLTTGERRRLGLARALVNKPTVLLADEPTAGLSEKSSARMLRLLGSLVQVGTTLVVTTRDVDLPRWAGSAALDLTTGRIG